jgi:hypothetical protein
MRSPAATVLAFAASVAAAGCQKTVTSDRPDFTVRSTNNPAGRPDVVTPAATGRPRRSRSTPPTRATPTCTS